MKNPYKKHLSCILKNASTRKLYLQRSDDFYYISDGFSILRLSRYLYELLAMPVDWRLVPLEAGQCATSSSGARTEATPGGVDLMRFFDGAGGAPVLLSPVFYNDGKKQRRILLCGGRPVAYDAEYVTAILSYATVERLRAGGGKYPALYADEPAHGCVVLPCRIPEEVARELHAVGELL